MREQTFEPHPLDRRVLLSQNLADIQRVDGINFKAGVIRSVADAEMKADLLAIPKDAPYLLRGMAAFHSAETAHPALQKDIPARTLNRLGQITAHFCERADKRDVVLVFSHNLGEHKDMSVQLHFEGMNPRGPSAVRDFRGNLSVSADDQPQMRWVPTDNLTAEDIRVIMSPDVAVKPSFEMQHAGSGDFVALHGLDYQYSDPVTDGLLHSGPDRHARVTVLWGIVHRDLC